MSVRSAVVRAALLVAAEGVALLVLAVVYAVAGVRGGAESVAGSEVGALLLAGSGVLLLLVARGLARRQAWARSPAVVVQLLAGLTALSLLQTLPVAAVVVLAVVVAVLVSLATPEARDALGRE